MSKKDNYKNLKQVFKYSNEQNYSVQGFLTFFISGIIPPMAK